MKTPQKAIILAAGLGTRMFPLSLDTPKPIMPLWGKPIIGHLLNLLARWGVKDILINLHFNPSPICEYLKRQSPANLRISFSFEPEILGTGGVLHRAGWFLDKEPFWMVNSDIAADLSPLPLLEAFTRKKTMAALWMEPTRGPLTVEMRRGNIVNFQTSRPGTKGTYTFCGLQLISPPIFQYLPTTTFSSIIRAYQNAMVAGWRVRGVCIPGSYWSDLGTPESYLQAHDEIRKRHRLKLSGQHLFNPRQNRQAAGLRKKGVLINGFAAIDETAVVRPGARIENSIVWRHAVIGSNAVIQNAIVGSECEINGRVPRLAVKSFPNEQYADIQLNLARARLKLDPSQAIIIPFEPRGSARSFTRITGRDRSYIMIRYSRERHENCLYAQQAGFLKKLGLNVPEIIADFPKQQLVVIQDLGDRSLQRIATTCPRAELIKHYRQTLKAIVFLHAHGATKAHKIHLEMVAPFSPDLYRWEREFFGRHFLAPHLHTSPSEMDCIMAELAGVGKALQRARQVLVHRDLQSSNIIFFNKKPFFIDFQGMRFGPAAYDLAALLCDPYISLTLKEQLYLLGLYNKVIRQQGQISVSSFWLAAVQRLAQALGAYGRLAAEKETAWFAQYIPPAVQMLCRALEQAKVGRHLHALLGGIGKRR